MRKLGLDVGDKTIGVAVSDELLIAANGITTIQRSGIRKDGDKFTVATDGWDYTADKVIIACGTNASVDNAGRLIAETAASR